MMAVVDFFIRLALEKKRESERLSVLLIFFFFLLLFYPFVELQPHRSWYECAVASVYD